MAVNEEYIRDAEIPVQANKLRRMFDCGTEIEALREVRHSLIQQTTICNGSTRAAVRTWVNDIDLDDQQELNQTVYIVSKTVTGPPRRKWGASSKGGPRQILMNPETMHHGGF